MSTTNPLIRSEDLDNYESVLESFTAGHIDEQPLLFERLLMGLYAQRQNGLYMLRVKLPGGWLTPEQLLGFATAAEQYSFTQKIHITTRQDIQLYSIKLQDTPDLLRLLASYNISTREACGNTVRNITSCPMAGACPKEVVDVGHFVRRTAQQFSNHPLTKSLPRKFKVSFSGCEADCAEGLIQDLAVIAMRNGDKNGFKILAGGGLGSKPREAVVLEPFIEEKQLLPVIEAVLALHEKYSDRKRRLRSRIKFLVERFGKEGFREKYLEELQRTQAAFDETSAPRVQWREPGAEASADIPDLRKAEPQHQAGYYALPVTVSSGQLTIAQLHGLKQLLEDEGLSGMRATQNQNLLIPHVAENRLESVQQRLADLDLSLPQRGDNIVSCPGTSTCPLGITSSRHVAGALNGGNSDLRIRINGCQNACANANIADIGLYGKGRRHFGKLVPSYVLQLGGDGSADGALAIEGPVVPAARAPSAVRRIVKAYESDQQETENFTAWSRHKGSQYFNTLLTDLINVNESGMIFLARDHGDSRIFQVKSAGVGECAGTKASSVDKLLLNAAYEGSLQKSFAEKNKFAEAGECLENRLLLAGRALLHATGQVEDQVELATLPNTLRKALPEAPTINATLDQIVVELDRFRSELDELAYPSLSELSNDWINQAREQCRHLQAHAKLEEKVG